MASLLDQLRKTVRQVVWGGDSLQHVLIGRRWHSGAWGIRKRGSDVDLTERERDRALRACRILIADRARARRIGCARDDSAQCVRDGQDGTGKLVTDLIPICVLDTAWDCRKAIVGGEMNRRAVLYVNNHVGGDCSIEH